uniref:Uncharacterized protein n=1 Tax=Oryza sativa subsp. japonica TaxID=39947 RepID=Q6ESF6_ORYSJ|nr:hypothetical protein [Oryza sativa Japonica Group]
MAISLIFTTCSLRNGGPVSGAMGGAPTTVSSTTTTPTLTRSLQRNGTYREDLTDEEGMAQLPGVLVSEVIPGSAVTGQPRR